VVGGISQTKQERVLSHRPHVVVGTAGRLWDLIDSGDTFLCDLSGLRVLVVDEADRMVEVWTRERERG
jgi:superfamily II DNA/RNA helicase